MQYSAARAIIYSKKIVGISFMVFLLLFTQSFAEADNRKDIIPSVHVPILLYHRFEASIADSMTVTTPVFESHLNYLSKIGIHHPPQAACCSLRPCASAKISGDRC
jgi:hypothetical protein